MKGNMMACYLLVQYKKLITFMDDKSVSKIVSKMTGSNPFRFAGKKLFASMRRRLYNYNYADLCPILILLLKLQL